MREMKNSGIEWIGRIPAKWNLVPAKRFFTNVKRIVGDKADNYDRLALTLKGVIKRSKDDSEGLQPEKFEGYQILFKNELVFKLIDLENVKTSRVGLSSYTGLVSPAYIVLSSNFPDNKFFYYWFMFMYYNEVFNHLGGEGVRSALNAKDVLLLPVPDIRLDEQRHIVDYLNRKCSQIDVIITRQKEIIEKLKNYKLSVITETVTKGLNPNVSMKDSGVKWVGEIPRHWKIAKIKNYCQLKTGITPSTSNVEWFEGEVQWFTPGDFNENYCLFKSKRTLSTKALESNVAVIAPANTVMIIGIGATAGKVGFSNIECSFNQQITALLTSSINPKFLMYWMIANTKFLRETALFTTLPILNNQTIGNYLLLCPEDGIEEKQIVDFLDDKCNEIENIISAKENIINKLFDYKKSLIYEVVTGKREV